MIGSNFDDMHSHNLKKVLPLAVVKHYKIDPLMIFHQMCVTNKNDEGLNDCMQYELALYPMSLFDETGMWKEQKSLFYKVFLTTGNMFKKGWKLHVRYRWRNATAQSNMEKN